jgi:hypothetical protein
MKPSAMTSIINSAFSLISPANSPIELPDEAVYCGLAGDIVRAIIPHSEGDPIALLIQFLACYGNIIGLKPHFMVEGTKHALKIYPVLVGATSKGRKGTAWGQVRRLFESIDSVWAEKNIVSGLSSGEGLIHAVNESEESPLGKRLLVVETEFASVLKVMRREGNTLSAILRNSWDGSYLQNLTKQNPLRAQNVHISIIGHVTIEELTRYLTETEMASGFGNRFLWVFTQRSKLLPDGGKIHTVNFAPFLKRLKEAVEFAKSAGEVERDAKANELWHKHYAKLSEGEVGLVGALSGRAEAYVMRFACLYALLDCTDKISFTHLTAALALWGYCQNSIMFIFGSSTGDPVADRILTALKSAPKGLDRTAINRIFAGHKKKAEIDDALDSLYFSNEIDSSEIETIGRPKQVWHYIAEKEK